MPVSDLLDSRREPRAAAVLLRCARAVPANESVATALNSSSPTATLRKIALRYVLFGSEAVTVTLVEPRVNGDIENVSVKIRHLGSITRSFNRIAQDVAILIKEVRANA